MIFEPNAEPGFTNRVLAHMATRIATGLRHGAQRFGASAVFTGIPGAPRIFRRRRVASRAGLSIC